MALLNRRGPWIPEEDQLLIHLVQSQGPNNWVRISQHMHYRSPKQCRERFHQNLKPSLNRTPITDEEGAEIERLVNEMGKRWAEIARRMGNRSDNAVKNWWNGSMNRKRRGLMNPGIAPKMHRPSPGRYSPEDSPQPYSSPSTAAAAAATTATATSWTDKSTTRDRPAPIRVLPDPYYTQYYHRPAAALETALPSPAYSELSSSAPSLISASSVSTSSSPKSIQSPQFVPPPPPPPHHYYYYCPEQQQQQQQQLPDAAVRYPSPTYRAPAYPAPPQEETAKPSESRITLDKLLN